VRLHASRSLFVVLVGRLGRGGHPLLSRMASEAACVGQRSAVGVAIARLARFHLRGSIHYPAVDCMAGAWSIALVGLLLIEIVLTLWDFIVEDWVRKPLGGLYPGERTMHAVMGILYGAMLACLVPNLRHWWRMPTELATSPVEVLPALRWAILLMGIGVLISGLRDLYAAFEMPRSAWPWKP